jgi:hypothetical protein
VRLKSAHSNSRIAARTKFFAAGLVFTAVALLGTVRFSRAQNPDTLLPEQSTAKGKQILQQLIDGLGGPTYLDIKDSDCEGRLARFGHNGEMTGYTNFKDFWRYPDSNRTEYSKKGVIINVYSGEKGWTLDKGGVSELSAASVADFQDQAKRDIHNLLRHRLNEPGMVIRYGGEDIADLRPVNIVDLTDAEGHNFRLAVDKTTRLLVRSVISTADKSNESRDVETNIYTNFQLMDGVRTAMQIAQDRNGRRSSQVFFTTCKYNTNLSPDLFSKSSLEQRFQKVGSRKSKEEKKKEKEAEKADN